MVAMAKPFKPDRTLVIACGALAREIVELKRVHQWSHMDLQCLDAKLHNTPSLIPELLRQRIRDNATRYRQIFVAYADCGTSGGIDQVIAAEGVERLPGAHCYQFYAGDKQFAALHAAEPGTFYLTDFLARNFERLVLGPLKIEQHPGLRDAYFGNYSKLVYLSQTVDADLVQRAQAAAARLDLEFEQRHCGYGQLEKTLIMQLSDEHSCTAPHRR